MKKTKVSFIRVETERNGAINVTFHFRSGIATHTYRSPSDNSLYRLLNNSMVSDICAYNDPCGLTLEVTPT